MYFLIFGIMFALGGVLDKDILFVVSGFALVASAIEQASLRSFKYEVKKIDKTNMN